MVNKKLNIVIVGLGYWGKNFLRLINSTDIFNLTAVVDPIKDNSNSIIQEEVNFYTDLEDCIDNEKNIDCAIVTTNTSSHYEITKKLLNCNINVLVEKPLTTNLIEAAELYNLADEKSVELMVDHTFLYDEGILALRELINSGELGELLHISFERTNLGPVRTDTNAAWDLSTHDLSILFSFTNKNPLEIYSQGMSYLNKNIQDIVNISINFQELFVTMFSSWLHPEKSRVIKVVGEKKMAVWNNLLPDQELKILDIGVEPSQNEIDYAMNLYKVKSGDITIPFINKKEPLKSVIEDFYSRVNGINGPSLNDKELTLKVIKTMEIIDNKL